MRAEGGPALALAMLIVVTSAPAAHAHLIDTGFGPFYNGVVHLLTTPEDVLPVLALTLWAGLCGPKFGLAVLLALPVAWLAGALTTLAAPWPLPGFLITGVSTVVMGGLAAAERPLPRGWMIVLATVLGIAHGALNGVVLSQTSLGIRGGVGIACAIFVVVSLGAGLVVSLRAPWTRVAVRAAGSWIAATGILMLGWGLRG
jgi:urease accessory protein